MNTIAETLSPTHMAAGTRRFPPHNTTRYVSGGHRSVEGWLTPLSASALAFLLEEQSHLGVRGSVGEIGVHHGKLFLVAYLATRTDERAFAVDVFDLQEFNVDQSGKGDRERFLANVERHAGSTDGLVVITADSLKLTADRILDEAGRARFVSVDGGHTEECTLNDLRLAEACLAEGGVIVLDDYFNHHWPDVSVGAARHFLSPQATTKPFLVTPNKVFFAEPRYHGLYQKAMRERFRPSFNNSGSMFGSAVDIYLIEGLRGLGGAVSSLVADEARMRLAGSPRLKAFLKRLVRR
jgi:methyltransferase family protein